MTDDIVVRRYIDGEYAERNPDWDSGDSPWKALRIAELLARHGIAPNSIVEIGCGAGGVLASLRGRFPGAAMAGFDISPSLPAYWKEHEDSGIRFVVGDYLTREEPVPDLTLVLDVLEHLGNPVDFLNRLRSHARHVIFHIPLDLSAVSVLRETPLLHVRHKVGHLHYFTKGLALSMLDEAGYEVVEASYTRAAFSVPRRGLKTRLAGFIRRAAFGLFGDAGVRLLGGETLIVLAHPRSGA